MRIPTCAGALALAALAIDCSGDASNPPLTTRQAALVTPSSGAMTSFEPAGGGRVRAVAAARGASRTATVLLPATAAEAVEVSDDTSGVAVKFALEGANDAPLRIVGGLAKYAGAVRGADLVHRVSAEGTEDFVSFDERPAREELTYRVDVSSVAALRLVSNVVEFLDAAGTPRLRVAPPYVVDAHGARHTAALALDGCAYDTSPVAPWGRAVVGPGARSCGLRVTWKSVAYPAVVDPAWTATGSMSGPRAVHTASVLGSGRVLVAGGWDGSTYPPGAELYDPTTGTFGATGSLVTARSHQTATVLFSGKVLISGGNNGTTLASAELYDETTGAFTATGAMQTARYDHSASLLGAGKVLVAGGHEEDTAEVYDPTAGTFAYTLSKMANKRYGHTASVLGNNKVLIAGGASYFAGSLAASELYDPITNSFAAAGTLTTPRYLHTATVLPGGRVLIAGGSNNGAFLGSAEIYDPVAGTFLATGSLVTARYGHTASILGSGKVLVACGYNGYDLASAEIYDPIAGTFAATGSLAHVREGHTASVLGNGKVLVTGGGYPLTPSAELFGLLDGSACSAGTDCVSDICNEGCCTGACSGPCTTCSGTGACVSVTNADDPDTCTGTQTCDGVGACKKKNGQTCTVPGDCAAGYCVGGVCCGTACTGGTCAGGVCVVPDAGADAASDAASDGSTDAAGDGSDGATANDAASDGGEDATALDAATDGGGPDSSVADGSAPDASKPDAATDGGTRKAEAASDSGCGCALPGRAPSERSGLGLLVALGVLFARRRRRGARGEPSALVSERQSRL